MLDGNNFDQIGFIDGDFLFFIAVIVLILEFDEIAKVCYIIDIVVFCDDGERSLLVFGEPLHLQQIEIVAIFNQTFFSLSMDGHIVHKVFGFW